MPLNITLTDYGVGNLYSIRRSLENCGANVKVVTDMSEVLDAECIVFPGVGAFDKTMERLQPYREDIRKKLLSTAAWSRLRGRSFPTWGGTSWIPTTGSWTA